MRRLEKMSVRVFSLLVDNGIKTVDDLLMVKDDELLSIKGFGAKALEVVNDFKASLVVSVVNTEIDPVKSFFRNEKSNPIIGEASYRLAISSLIKLSQDENKLGESLLSSKYLPRLLKENYLDRNIELINNAINRISENNKRMLKQSVVGSLFHKLADPYNIGGFNSFERVEYKYWISTLVVQFICDNVFEVTNELNKIPNYNEDGSLKEYSYKTEFFIEFGGKDQVVNVLKNYILDTSGKRVRNDKYVHTKITGKKIKLSSRLKMIPEVMSSQKRIVSDICSEKLLKFGYSLSQSMNKSSRESARDKDKRFQSYADMISNQLSNHSFSYGWWFDSRLRLYVNPLLTGLNPQGKLWETLMIDSSESYVINDNGVKHLIHIIMVTLDGRITKDEANNKFNDNKEEVLNKLKSIDPYSVEGVGRGAEDEFGEKILLVKAYKAYVQYLKGEPTHYIFGKDLTNSGIGGAGMLFKSTKMLNSGSYGVTQSVDSHNEFNKPFVLPRPIIKTIHTGLLHGSTWKTAGESAWKEIKSHYFREYSDKFGASDAIVELHNKYDNSIDPDVIRKNAIKSYGEEVNNIDHIASFGGDLINSKTGNLLAKTLDGEIIQSSAYAEKVKRTIKVPCSSNKSGWASTTVTSDMPLQFDSNGRLLTPSEEKGNNYGISYDGSSKKRGLYANMVHSIDAMSLRMLISLILMSDKQKKKFLMSMFNNELKVNHLIQISKYVDKVIDTKHDDYITSLNNFGMIEEALQIFASHILEIDYAEDLLEQFSHNSYAQSGIKIVPPVLIYGNADNSIPFIGANFLMP